MPRECSRSRPSAPSARENVHDPLCGCCASVQSRSDLTGLEGLLLPPLHALSIGRQNDVKSRHLAGIDHVSAKKGHYSEPTEQQLDSNDNSEALSHLA